MVPGGGINSNGQFDRGRLAAGGAARGQRAPVSRLNRPAHHRVPAHDGGWEPVPDLQQRALMVWLGHQH
jgi:hypothetical protein